MNRERKFWIGVASFDHVKNGVKLGICQVCHGKPSPLKRMKKNDFIIYYSSKISMNKADLLQQFTAIGLVKDDEIYQVEVENNFQPFRRNIHYLDAKQLDIKPLIPYLSFIKNKKTWGYVFRYGFLEIDQPSFLLIAERMLGFNPLEN